MRRPGRSSLLAALAASALTAGVARAQADADAGAPDATPPPQAAAPPPQTAPPPASSPPAAPRPATPQPSVTPPPAYPAPPYPYPYPYYAPGYPYAPWPGYGATTYAPPPPPARAPTEVATVAAPPPGSARVPADDPQADRGVLAPTAYTHPKGTFYLSDYEVFVLQLGYALTDDTQISVTGLPPLGDERVLFLDVTLKTSLYRGGLVRVAALGSASGLGAKEIGAVGIGRAGAVVQLCVQRECSSSLSLSSNLALAGELALANGASGIFRVGRVVSLLAELDTLVPLGKDIGQVNGGLAAGGVRFRGTHWGLDLSLVHVLGKDATTFPLVTLSYRSGS